MGVLDQNIELFTYRSQVKITELGGQMLSDDLNGLCIDKYIDLIDQLDSAIYLLQNATDDMSDNEKEEVMSYLYDKANLNPLPLPLYRQCGCHSPVSVTSGYIPVPGPTGATGPQGPQGVGVPGNDGVDGKDGLNGWTSVQSIVTDGSREVVKISDWIGGTGNKPTTLPVYIGATGFVTSISQAVNIKGSAGPVGPTGGTGVTGPSGASAYVYTAYADSDDGTGYTLTFNASKYYIAIITTTAPITPAASDFTGKWFKWKGEVGPALNINERGPLSDRSLYDNETQDFIYFSIDTNEIYIKDTGLPGDWSDPIPFGGNQGWSPVISVHQDGDRVVLYVGGWVGGQGSYPATSGYVSGSGLTNNISFAVDIRGSRGKRFYPDAQDVIGNISLYNDAPPEYVFYATDEGKVYIKQTSLTGDWSVGYVWRGPQGPQGPVGSMGNGYNEDCRVATTTNLLGTYISGVFTFSSNGAISIDSTSLSQYDRVLVKNQTTGSENGIYIVTTVGTVSTPGVLTRATDFDSTIDVKKFQNVFIKEGVVNSGTIWFLLNREPSVTLDSTSITFAKIDNSGIYLYKSSDGSYQKGISSSGANLVIGSGTFDALITYNFRFSATELTGLSVNSINLWLDNYKIIKKDAGSPTDLGVLGHYIITDSTVITNITTIANWSGTTYSGPGITGQYKGQYYYDASYFYFMVTNTVPVRMARA
jgi:hypothetical protein